MLVKRDVYFSTVGENGEEKLFSTRDVDGRKKEEKREKTTRIGDEFHIGINKALLWKKARKAGIDVLDEDAETAKKGRRALSKEAAKAGAVITGVGAGIVATRRASKAIGNSVAKTVGAAVGGTIGGAAVGGLAGYVNSRIASKANRVARNVSSMADAQARRNQDQLKVANGDMTRKEFIEKYGKEAGRLLN